MRMRVPVVGVREVGMDVLQGDMLVRMGVACADGDRWNMPVVMMGVACAVHVRMAVCHRLVAMRVQVPFAQMHGVRIIRGNDVVVAPQSVFAPPEGAATNFRFEDAPIREVAQAILGDLLKLEIGRAHV